MNKLRVLDLFSGIGGFSLGLERTGGFETVAFCEIEPFCQKVLKKHWPEVPVFDDVRELKGSEIGTADVICGGYPCQPFSTAGKRLGKEDDRHLWPEFMRLVAELRPSWVIGENVAGHISMGLDDVLTDLENAGYTARTFVIPACALGAHHRRDRCWTIAQASIVEHAASKRTGRSPQSGKSSLTNQASEGLEQGWNALVAHTKSERQPKEGQFGCRRSKQITGTSSTSFDVADAVRERPQVVYGSGHSRQAGGRTQSGCESFGANAASGAEQWLIEPNVGRVANGIPNRVDRLKALGNAVVPQIPEIIGHAILEAHHAS